MSEPPEQPLATHRCHICAHQYTYKPPTTVHLCPECGNLYDPITDPFKPVYSQRFLYEKLREQAEILQAAWRRLMDEAAH